MCEPQSRQVLTIACLCAWLRVWYRSCQWVFRCHQCKSANERTSHPARSWHKLHVQIFLWLPFSQCNQSLSEMQPFEHLCQKYVSQTAWRGSLRSSCVWPATPHHMRQNPKADWCESHKPAPQHWNLNPNCTWSYPAITQIQGNNLFGRLYLDVSKIFQNASRRFLKSCNSLSFPTTVSLSASHWTGRTSLADVSLAVFPEKPASATLANVTGAASLLNYYIIYHQGELRTHNTQERHAKACLMFENASHKRKDATLRHHVLFISLYLFKQHSHALTNVSKNLQQWGRLKICFHIRKYTHNTSTIHCPRLALVRLCLIFIRHFSISTSSRTWLTPARTSARVTCASER